MNTCICIGVTGSVSLTEAVQVSSSIANPVWVTGTLGFSDAVRPTTGSYQAFAFGLLTTSLSGAMASIHNSGTHDLFIRRVSVGVTFHAFSNAGGAGFVIGGRATNSLTSSVGTAVPIGRLDTSMPASHARVYSGPSDVPVSLPMAGGVFPAAYPHLVAFNVATGSVGSVTTEVELVGGRSDRDDVVLAPNEAYSVVADLTMLVDGAPEIVYGVTFAWEEGS